MLELCFVTSHGMELYIGQGKNHNLDFVLHFLNVLFIELAVYCNHLIKKHPRMSLDLCFVLFIPLVVFIPAC